jgi:hypothetical protein
MKFSAAAVLAAAAGASAGYAHGNVTYTTVVVEEIVTYCPEPTTLTHGDHTYTVTAPTTLTITDCPCTISKPVYTTSYVVCPTWRVPLDRPLSPSQNRVPHKTGILAYIRPITLLTCHQQPP